MTSWLMAALAAIAMAASALITIPVREYAVRRYLLDHPNERGAHHTPTPRGGGTAFVVTYLALVGLLANRAVLASHQALAIAGAGILVAGIGLIDDHGHVSARWRLLAHFLGATWLLVWLGGLPGEALLANWSIPSAATYVVASITIVWLINLYNFMDGIDGIASVQAIAVSVGAALCAIAAGRPELAPPLLLLAAAVCGFAYWNWPPARIFMGDVGSGFLGVTLGGLALMSGLAETSLIGAWAILLGVFITDSGVTLARRALRGERLYEAHRMHAYQHAARHFGSHRRVTVTVGVINLFWLLPLALAVVLGRLPAWTAFPIAYVPLLVLALRWNAGCPERNAGLAEERNERRCTNVP